MYDESDLAFAQHQLAEAVKSANLADAKVWADRVRFVQAELVLQGESLHAITRSQLRLDDDE